MVTFLKGQDIMSMEADQMKKEKIIIGLITLAFLITAISIPSVLSNTSQKIHSNPDFYLSYTPNLAMEETTSDWIKSSVVDSSIFDNNIQIGTDADTQVSPFIENDAHPAIAIDGNGNPFIVYDHESDFLYHELIFQRSLDRGNTWQEGDIIFILSSEEYNPINPTFDITDDGTRGVATFQNLVPEPSLSFIDAVDINDIETWLIYSFTADSDYIGGSAIAAYGNEIVVFARITDVAGSDGNTYEEKCLVSWFPFDSAESIPGVFYAYEIPMSKPDVAAGGERLYAACEMNDVDKTSVLVMWAPYDLEDYTGWSASTITRSSSNCTNPQLAIAGTNRYCVVENDINGNKDILCYRQTGTLWRRNTVVDTADDETYPAVTAEGDTVTVTFIKNGNLYMSKSEDQGTTWSEPVQVNDVDGAVVGDYRSQDLNGPYMAWTDNRNDNSDIYFDIGTAPLVGISSVSGGFGVKATIENTGTADTTDVEWSINVDAPLMLIGGESNGTISSLPAGDSETIKTGFLLGIGSGTITITADQAGATRSGFILGPFVLNVQ